MRPDLTRTNYAERSRLLTPMGAKIEALIEDIITAERVAIHSIEHRIKTESSAETKLARDPAKYSALEDLHDFLGVRVITHLASDVDSVVAALRREFDVDEVRSLDKQTRLDPDRFGYLSFHLVVRLDESRKMLPEWGRFGGVYFEIQVRSILQHAWAEIEHDLGYKATSIIPPQVRRRFARLAGLLELADSEFVAIASALDEHTDEVESAIQKGRPVAIDAAAVRFLVTHDDTLRQIDEQITAKLGTTLDQRVSKRYADSMASHLVAAGFEVTDEVSWALRENPESLATFAADWISRADTPTAAVRTYSGFSRGIALYYLSLHTALVDSNTAFFDRMSRLQAPDQYVQIRRIHDSAFATT